MTTAEEYAALEEGQTLPKVQWKKGTENATKILADNKYTTIELEALTSGEFTLEEDTPPSGYSKPDYKWNIKVIFDPTGNAHNTGISTQDYFDIQIKTTQQGSTYTSVKTNDYGFFTADLINGASEGLPTTGGIGTTIFYIVGSVMLIGAAVLLVTKKRMGAND